MDCATLMILVFNLYQ